MTKKMIAVIAFALLGPICSFAQNASLINGHEYVDLGLSVKWATCNVGASSPEDNGGYFAWGETTTKSSYSVGNSSTYGKEIKGFSYSATRSYTADQSTHTISQSNNASQLEMKFRGNRVITKEVSNTSKEKNKKEKETTSPKRNEDALDYDAARANWAGTWRMPTAEEIDELIRNCNWQWITSEGHNGYRVTGPNGNSIFLPAAGYRSETSLNNEGESGYYWSSTPSVGSTFTASYLGFRDENLEKHWGNRYYGIPIRPVSD